MPHRTPLYQRRRRMDRIEEIRERQIEAGLLHIVKEKDEEGRELESFQNRTLADACEWRMKEKDISKKQIAAELRDRLALKPGKRETARLEGLLERFS